MTRREWLDVRLAEASRREGRRVSLRELARLLGCNHATVYAWARRVDGDEGGAGAALVAHRWGAPRVTRARIVEALSLD